MSRIMNYIRMMKNNPITILELVNNILFFVIIFIPMLRPYFFILILSSLAENILKKQYKRIPIKIGVLILFYAVSYFLGTVGVIILLLIVISVVMYKIYKKQDAITSDFRLRKDKMVLDILKTLQPKETEYMRQLKVKVHDDNIRQVNKTK